jgi:hypothetical protein
MLLLRQDYETVKVSCAMLAVSLLVYNIDDETMRVKNTTYLHDPEVEKRLAEIQSLGLAAIPVFDFSVSGCVHEGRIDRCGDLLLSSEGKDMIVDTPITWTTCARRYDGDGVTPLRFGMLSMAWRQRVFQGTLKVVVN